MLDQLPVKGLRVCATIWHLEETETVLSTIRILLLSAVLLTQTGCAVVAVADAFVSVVSTTVEVTADVIGAAVDVVIPD